MTVKALMDEVVSLGFSDGISDERGFYFAANRAAAEIAKDRPTVKTLTVRKENLLPKKQHPTVTHPGGTDVSVPLSGGSCTFRVSGEGTYGLAREGTYGLRPFRGENVLCKLPAAAGDVLLFSGEYDYTVYDLCEYDAAPAPGRIGLCVKGEPLVLRGEEIDENFLAFTDYPMTPQGRAVPILSASPCEIRVKEDYEGQILLSYGVLPKKMAPDEPGANIDLCPAVLSLLPLLTAAYLWLDEEPAKAQYYMGLYRSGMRSLRESDLARQYGSYQTTDHWA